MCEFAEAVQIDLVEQCRECSVQRFAVDDDLFRHCGLVITDAGDQMQQAQCRREGRFAAGRHRQRGVGEADRFDQFRAVVEAVDEGGAGGRGVVIGACEMEGPCGARLFETHSITSSAAARRL